MEITVKLLCFNKIVITKTKASLDSKNGTLLPLCNRLLLIDIGKRKALTTETRTRSYGKE